MNKKEFVDKYYKNDQGLIRLRELLDEKFEKREFTFKKDYKGEYVVIDLGYMDTLIKRHISNIDYKGLVNVVDAYCIDEHDKWDNVKFIINEDNPFFHEISIEFYIKDNKPHMIQHLIRSSAFWFFSVLGVFISWMTLILINNI